MSDDQSQEQQAQDQQGSGEQDPLQQVAGAMIKAADAVQEGAADARVKAQQYAPKAKQMVSKTVYATCYYLSYGVVFPTLLVASFVPMDNALGHGLIDGTGAAKDSVAQMKARRAAMKQARHEAKQRAFDMAGAASFARLVS